jgi:hypothetical protein
MDGNVFSGTKAEIVEAMRKGSFEGQQLTLQDYVKWVARNVRTLGYRVEVQGETDTELAESLISEAVRAGFLEEVVTS